MNSNVLGNKSCILVFSLAVFFFPLIISITFPPRVLTSNADNVTSILPRCDVIRVQMGDSCVQMLGVKGFALSHLSGRDGVYA